MTKRNYWKKSRTFCFVHLIICLDFCWVMAAVAGCYSSTMVASIHPCSLFASCSVIFFGDLLLPAAIRTQSICKFKRSNMHSWHTTICDSCSPIDSSELCLKSIWYLHEISTWSQTVWLTVAERNRSNHKSLQCKYTNTHTNTHHTSSIQILLLRASNSIESKQVTNEKMTSLPQYEW